MKAIVLLSGGMDSAVCLALARSAGYETFSLTFDYAQRHSVQEVAAAVAIDPKTTIVYVELPWGGSSLIDDHLEIPKAKTSPTPSTYVPARNTVFLALAMSYAEVVGAEAIYIGANALDHTGYPDCRPEFFDTFRLLSLVATRGPGVAIAAPLLQMTKKQIVQLGRELGVDFSITHSCYDPQPEPCGRCDACVLRAEALG